MKKTEIEKRTPLLLKKERTSVLLKGARDTHDSESKRKIIMLNIFLFIGFVLLLTMGMIAFLQKNQLLAFADLLMATISGVILIYLHTTGKEAHVSLWTVSLVFIFFSALFIIGGVSSTSFMWLYCFPVFSLFLLGQQKGLIFIALLFLICSAYIAVDLSTTVINVYTVDFALRFLPTLFSVSILSWLVEDSRAATVNELQMIKENLEEQVVARTSELEKLNDKLKSEIEERKTSEIKKMHLEKELKQAEKLKLVGELAGGVAHDLNNVLSGIVSYPDLILHKLADDSEIRKPLENIKRSGLKAAAIIDDLLSLARRYVVKKEYINLNRIISEHFHSTENIILQYKKPDIRIKQHLFPELPLIYGSPIHLQKVIMNLLGNSFDAITGYGEIYIITSVEAAVNSTDQHQTEPVDYVVLTVSDTGQGMPHDTVNKIFEPFYTSKVMGRSGTGLGMTIVWGVVQDHGGFLDVRSSVGSGTTIKVYLPVSSNDNNEIIHHKPVLQIGQEQKILLVDDDPEQRALGCSILETLNYTAFLADSGEDAIEFLKTSSVDLVLLDMIMSPKMDGLDTFKVIKTLHPNLPVVLITGYAETKRIQSAFELGVRSLIKKPYTLQNFADVIKAEISK